MNLIIKIVSLVQLFFSLYLALNYSSPSIHHNKASCSVTVIFIYYILAEFMPLVSHLWPNSSKRNSTIHSSLSCIKILYPV